MATIFFAGDDQIEHEVADGTRLQDAIDECGADILFGCREGACATCMIEIVEGSENLNPINENEEATLMPEELESGVRLACQCVIRGGRIVIKSADGAA